jgi:hypothetical protein
MANLNYTFPNGFSIYTHNASASNTFASIQGLQGISRIWGVNPSDTSDITPYIPGSPFNPQWLTAFVPGSSYQVVSDGTASIQVSGSYPGITRRVFASGVTGTLGYAYFSMPINSVAVDLRTATVTATNSTVTPLSSIVTTIWTPVIQGAGAYQTWLSFNGGTSFNNQLFGGTSLLPGSAYYFDFGSSTGDYTFNIPRKNSYLITNNGDFIITNNGNNIVVQQGL